MIRYTKAAGARRATYRTPRYSNLLADTVQAEVSDNEDGTWSAWCFNFSTGKNRFRLNCPSLTAAKQWGNACLREYGVQ